jgi:hypothetical protein
MFMPHSDGRTIVDDTGHGFCDYPAGRIVERKFVAVPQSRPKSKEKT